MKIKIREGYSNVFPQANDIYKLFLLCDFLFMDGFDKEKIMKLINVNSERQVQYYLSAGKYIGLIDTRKQLTEIGKLIFSQDKNNKLQLVCYQILSNNIFADYFIHRNINKTVILLNNSYYIAKSTLPRRISSLRQWIQWCDVILNDFQIGIEWE
jgi:hypothetical protein